MIKTISTNLLTTFEENFEWDKADLPKRDSKVIRMPRPELSRKPSTEDLGEIEPFKPCSENFEHLLNANAEIHKDSAPSSRRSTLLKEPTLLELRRKTEKNTAKNSDNLT